MTSKSAIAVTLSAGLMSLSATICSQDFPTKPIRIITSAVGGGNDFAARIIAAGIAGPMKQSVIVDNRASLQAVDTMSKAQPDGYSMLVAGGSIWILPLLQKTPYEVSDLAPVSFMVREVTILVVHPSVPAINVKELIALAKAKPGQLNYSSTVTAGSSHLAAELFKSMAGVNIVQVPYKGSSAALAGIVAGEVQVAIDGVQLLPLIKSGKLRALGVSTLQPTPLAPGMPTIASSGLPGYEWLGICAMWTRAKTPAPIINRLNQEIVRVLNQPETKEKFFNSGAEVVASTPEQFMAMVNADIVRMRKLIADAGIKVD